MTRHDKIKTIAERFRERAAALNLKGKKRDDAALDYFVGAAVGAELAGDADLAQAIALAATLIVSVRGFIGVSDIAFGRFEK
jgi:hypothetical protein